MGGNKGKGKGKRIEDKLDIRSVLDGVLIVRDHRFSAGGVLEVLGEVTERPLT